MTNSQSQRGAIRALMAFFALVLPVLAYLVWDQALDFDPCNNILKHPGVDCLDSGAGGIAVGAAVLLSGLAITSGAIRKGRAVYGNLPEPALMAWIGLSMALTGAGFAYAGATMYAR